MASFQTFYNPFTDNFDYVNSPVIPPSVAIQFEDSNGDIATPQLNIIKFLGSSTTLNDQNGVRFESNPIGTTGTNNEVVQLTNRLFGTAVTNGVETKTLFSFDLGDTPGTFLFETNCVVYDRTSATSASFKSFRTVRTTGAVGVLISASSSVQAEEDGSPEEATLGYSLVGNVLNFTALGVTGLELSFLARATYDFIN